jgi:protoporphyrinogen oxidase
VTTVVIGAGMAGIGAAHRLRARGESCVVLEATSGPGGLASTDRVDGFLFDRTGHFFHFSRPNVRQCFLDCGVALQSHRRRAGIAVRGRIVPYPLQYNLWALADPGLAHDAVESVAAAQATSRSAPPPRSFGEHLAGTWGETLLSLFFRPYNAKLWRQPLESLPADCAGNLAPPPNLELMRRGCLGPVAYEGYNGTFLYPESGRLGDVVDALVSPLGDTLRFESGVTTIDLAERTLGLASGKEIGFDRLVSTMPLPGLLTAAGLSGGDEGLLDATSIANVRVALRGALHTRLHWLYVPDSSVELHRIGFPSNVNPRTCPPGCVSLSLEYTLPERGRRTTIELAAAAAEYLTAMRLLEVEECLSVSEVVLSPAYVVWRSIGRPWFAEIGARLRRQGVQVAGRFGRWDYLSMEDAFLSGADAVDALQASATTYA